MKRKDFIKKLHEIYNDKNIHLSSKSKKELLNQYKTLSLKRTNVYYASFKLYPYIKKDSYNNKSQKLDEFIKILQKNKWKAYFVMVRF